MVRELDRQTACASPFGWVKCNGGWMLGHDPHRYGCTLLRIYRVTLVRRRGEAPAPPCSVGAADKHARELYWAKRCFDFEDSDHCVLC